MQTSLSVSWDGRETSAQPRREAQIISPLREVGTTKGGMRAREGEGREGVGREERGPRRGFTAARTLEGGARALQLGVDA